MENPNAQHLSIETQNYLRQQAIRLKEQGKRVDDRSGGGSMNNMAKLLYISRKGINRKGVTAICQCQAITKHRNRQMMPKRSRN